MDESVLVTKCFPANVSYFCISASEVCKDCSPSVEQSLPNEIMADCAGHVGNQCVTIVTDAIHCGSQVLDDQRTKDAEPDDGGIFTFAICGILICPQLSLVEKKASTSVNSVTY